MDDSRINKQTLIDNLMDALQQIGYRDTERLEKFKEHADAIIKNFNGDTSNYRFSLKMTRFAPWSAHVDEDEYIKSWNTGKVITFNILKAINEDEKITYKGNHPDVIEEENPEPTPVPSSEPLPQTPVPLSSESVMQTSDVSLPLPPEEMVESNASDFKQTEGPLEDAHFMSEDIREEEKMTSAPSLIDVKKTIPTGIRVFINSLVNKLKSILTKKLWKSEAILPVSNDVDQIQCPSTLEEKFLQTEAQIPALSESLQVEARLPPQETHPPETPNADVPALESSANPAPMEVSAETKPKEPEQTLPQDQSNQVPAAASPEPNCSPPAKQSNRILIVNGSDMSMNEKVLVLLRKLGFEGILSYSEENYSKTVATKMLEFKDIAFVVVLLTYDGYFYLKEQKVSQAKLISNYKVIFEMGYLIGKIGRNKVFVLYPEKKNFELPSLFFDAYYIPYDKSRAWEKELIKAFTDQGFPTNDINTFQKK